MLARALQRYLKSWGYESVIARSGTDAWRALKRPDAPSVVILDWGLEGLSGLEVCRLFRATPHGATAYVLMLTGRQHKTDLIEALEAGADDFLSKPFHARELQLRLAKGIALREASVAKVRAAEVALPPTGTIIGGKYRLERRIAEGGMATVWLGVHLSLGVNVAIKFMNPDLAETADYASFEREARALAQLRNEHIVRVYDHGLDSAGLPYLVMEYLGGESLASRINRNGALAPSEVVSIVEQIAKALGEGHARGIVHRDVKPENVLVVEDAEPHDGVRVKLIDFGLARPGPLAAAKQSPENGAMLAGTPCFMSPEHLRGEAAPDARLDLWSLAVTTFCAMTGKLPFDGDSLAAIYLAICERDPPLPSAIAPDVPTGFDTWFVRACAREPDARFQSANELATALRVAVRESAPRPPKSAAASSASRIATEPYSPPR
jgi:serine/threonine-protein kinase